MSAWAEARADNRRRALRAVQALARECDELMAQMGELVDATDPPIPWRLDPRRERMRKAIMRAIDTVDDLDD